MTQFINILFVIISLVCAAMDSAAQEVPSQPIFNVGYKVLDFKYQKDGREEVLTVAVWYPTVAQPQSYNYGGSLRGTVALDGVPLSEGGPFPLLVFSHGYGGGGLSAVFFTERLAAYGWIVAAPDHHDKYPAVRIRSGQLEDFNRRGFLKEVMEIGATGPDGRSKYLYRLDEMKRAIDGMMISEQFSKIIDSRRIAVGGHSFGGFTALGLCGTIKEHLDTRIKAILLFSTGAGGYLFREDELAGVRMPSMLFLGEREREQLRGAETMSAIANKIYSHLFPPKYFLEVKGANHFSFNNGFTDDFRARFLSGTPEQFDVIRRYSIAFLEMHVAGKKDAGRLLEHGDAMPTRYLRE